MQIENVNYKNKIFFLSCWQHVSDGRDFPTVIGDYNKKRTPHFSFSTLQIFNDILGIYNSYLIGKKFDFIHLKGTLSLIGIRTPLHALNGGLDAHSPLS